MYHSQDTIRGLTIQQTLEYFFLVSLIQGLTGVHFEGWRTEEIKLGKIDFFLIRPFSYLKEIIFSDIAFKLFYFCVFIPLYALFFLSIEKMFHIELFSQIQNTNLISFLLFLGVGYCIQMCIALSIVFLSFWFESAEGLQHFKWVLLTVFSGGMVPLEFMPEWLRTVTQFLPFHYLSSFPIQLLQQRAVIETTDVLIIFFTVISMSMGVKILYDFGISKYSSAGG